MVTFDARHIDQPKSLVIQSVAGCNIPEGAEVITFHYQGKVWARPARDGERANGTARHTAVAGTTLTVLVAEFAGREK